MASAGQRIRQIQHSNPHFSGSSAAGFAHQVQLLDADAWRPSFTDQRHAAALAHRGHHQTGHQSDESSARKGGIFQQRTIQRRQQIAHQQQQLFAHSVRCQGRPNGIRQNTRITAVTGSGSTGDENGSGRQTFGNVVSIWRSTQ